MKTRIARDVATARRAKRPIPAAGTAGWAQAEADRARIRTVLRAPPDWRASATTSVPAPTGHKAASALAADRVMRMPAPEVAATSALPQISRKAARNALLPSLALVGFYGGSGLAGPPNPLCLPSCDTTSVPRDFSGALANGFNNSSPDYYVGLNLNIPFRNRIAKADQYRSELEYRQAELRMEQLKKQVRIEVRNAQYAQEQTGARVQAARKARDLAQRTFDIMRKEQDLGAGSSYQTLAAQRDLSLAELDLVSAMTVYEKAKVELDRATGTTLEHNGILLQDAVSGTVSAAN